MTNRRTFIKTLAAIPPALTIRRCWAVRADSSRLALVIGNGAYQDSPLVNPTNDARAMATLFEEAGFSVASHLDASRVGMMAAIENFVKAVQRSETQLAVFYYAGHGAQLDWRNYLLPIDARVTTADQLRQGCIDLNMLLSKLGKTKDKTFVIMLDACRNNPFGDAYRLEQKGLSQFDAPVGSLLAYATAPGNVASDGSGKNGLYTENLLRELSVRGARIEDALKRVRLNVRLASNGAQVPWETTSLESDVYVFDDGQKKPSYAELETDLAEWDRIKSSRKVDDWVAYLRNFPNGRFAEIAQVRLNGLLAAKEAWSSITMSAAQTSLPSPVGTPVAAPAAVVPAMHVAVAAPAPAASFSTAPSATPVASTIPDGPAPYVAPLIELAEGRQAPQLLQQSANPFSSGRYPLGRKFSVGDEAVLRVSDLISGVQTDVQTLRVTRVDIDADRVECNNGNWIFDTMGNALRSLFPIDGESDVPQQILPAELYVGKKWSGGRKMRNRYGDRSQVFDLNVAAFEKVRTSVGEFNAFRIDCGGSVTTELGHTGSLERRIWVVPGINFALKDEVTVRFPRGYGIAERIELVSLRQHTFDIACTTTVGGAQRNLAIKSGCA